MDPRFAEIRLDPSGGWPVRFKGMIVASVDSKQESATVYKTESGRYVGHIKTKETEKIEHADVIVTLLEKLGYGDVCKALHKKLGIDMDEVIR